MDEENKILFTTKEVDNTNVEEYHNSMVELLDMYDITTSILDYNQEYKEDVILTLIELYLSVFSIIEVYNKLERYEYSQIVYDKLKKIYIIIMDRFEPESDNEEAFKKIFESLSDKFQEDVDDK